MAWAEGTIFNYRHSCESESGETKEGAMQEKYERIKARSGAKRAIVATARTLLLRSRRMLLDGRPYTLGLIR